MDGRRWSILWVVLVLTGTVQTAWGLGASNVLVLYNANSPDGLQIANYYAQVHPGVRLLGVSGVAAAEVISAQDYLNVLRPQVMAGLTQQTDCIVTTKGLPLRIDNAGTGPGWSRYSSLESELARVDTINTTALMANQGWSTPVMFGGNPLAANPFYDKAGPFSYSNAQYGTRLTARLDGFTVADVKSAIDRAQRVVYDRPGMTFLIDDYPGRTDRMGELVQNVLAPRGLDYTYEQTTAFLGGVDGQVVGYVSHGVHGGAPSGYLAGTPGGVTFDIADGAVFHSWESYNAVSFSRGGNRDGQALVAEWIALGGTVGVGHVEEPGASMFSVANEDRMFRKLLEGYTWAEAAWYATTQLSFVNTVVGDPLMQWKAWVEGDVDLDGDVDGWDLVAVKSAYWTSQGEADYDLMADMNADGKVDGWDLVFVKSRFTGPLPPEFALEIEQVLAEYVPEPASLCLLALAGLGLLRRRPRRF